MNRIITLGLGIALGAGALALTAACVPDDQPITDTEERQADEDLINSMPDVVLVPCPEEDSRNCYWDAARQGNGIGTSFVNLDGTVYYPR